MKISDSNPHNGLIFRVPVLQLLAQDHHFLRQRSLMLLVTLVLFLAQWLYVCWERGVINVH